MQSLANRKISSAATKAAARPSRNNLKVAASAQPYDRVYNFSAGPAMLPVDVLEEAQTDMMNWKGTGMCIMEMSHRSKEFDGVAKKAEADLRTLLSIPDNYKGGASTQFAFLPLNLTASNEDVTDYVVTGAWSKKAIEEGQKYSKANLVAKGDGKSIPDPSTWTLSEGSKYVHYCDNETIGGVEFKSAPDVGGRVLVADMSSNFVSKPVDVSKYGIIYAGAQKNVGPSGVTIAIVRDDLIGHARDICPTMLDYKTHADNDSMYNTPPCWAIYMCGMVFAKLLKEGGLDAVLKANETKAKILYDAIDSSNGFYNNPVAPAARSSMNVPFTIPSSPDLEKLFLKETAAMGMQQLKGHRSVGGMRASIYNAVPLEGVQALADYMKDHASRSFSSGSEQKYKSLSQIRPSGDQPPPGPPNAAASSSLLSWGKIRRALFPVSSAEAPMGPVAWQEVERSQRRFCKGSRHGWGLLPGRKLKGAKEGSGKDPDTDVWKPIGKTGEWVAGFLIKTTMLIITLPLAGQVVGNNGCEAIRDLTPPGKTKTKPPTGNDVGWKVGTKRTQ
eukprot:gene16460-22681_t